MSCHRHGVVLAMCMAATVAWGADKDTKPGKPPEFADSRALLKVFAIDDSHWALLSDGKAVADAELPAVLRVLYRAPTLPPLEIERLAKPQVDLAALGKNPTENRGLIVRLRGKVTSVEALKCPADLAARFEFEQYYRCLVRLDQPAVDVAIYVRDVPAAWRKGGKFDQPVGALGVFLKLGSSAADKPLPVFGAARLAWYPDTLLGALGMDCGLLDGVRDRTSIQFEEQEAFYQMLAAVGRAKPLQLMHAAEAELARAGRQEASVVPLFNQADAERGRLVVLQGSAKRVVKVLVDDRGMRARFGFDHYYEIDMFTHGTRAEPDADSRGNPIVFCVRDLPPGMPVGEGAFFGETVRIAGFYFKHWAYPLPREKEDGKKTLQLAPLLIAEKPVWIYTGKPESSYVTQFVVGGIVVAVSLGIWIFGMRSMRRQRAIPLYRQPGAATIDAGPALQELARQDKINDNQTPPGESKT